MPHNNMHYHEQWKAHRKAVRDLRATYERERKRLAPYQDSAKGREELARAEKSFRDSLDSLAASSRAKFDSIISDMEKNVQAETMTAPTQEQLAILQMLDMRDSLDTDELAAACKAMAGCDPALKTLNDIVTRKGKVLPTEVKPAEAQRRDAVGALRRAAYSLCAWDGRTAMEVSSDASAAYHDYRWGGGPAPTGHERDSQLAADLEECTYFHDTVRKISGASTEVVQALDK